MTDVTRSAIPGGFRLALRAGLPAGVVLWGAALVGRLPVPGVAHAGAAAALSHPGRALAWYLVTSIVSAAASAAVIVVLAARARGTAPAGGAVLKGLARVWSIWIAGLIYAGLVTAGLIVFLVPGFVLSVAWILYAPAAVLGGSGPIAALAAGYARARTDWRELGRRIAGPLAFYGAVYALSAAPLVFATARGVAAGAFTDPGLLQGLAQQTPPAWFAWGVLPLCFTAAQLYWLAGITSAWLALEK